MYLFQKDEIDLLYINDLSFAPQFGQISEYFNFSVISFPKVWLIRKREFYINDRLTLERTTFWTNIPRPISIFRIVGTIFLKTIFEIFLQPRSSIKRVFSKKKKRTSISLDRLISIDSRQDGRIDTATRNSAEAIESWRSPMRIARGEEGGQGALYRAVETVFIQWTLCCHDMNCLLIASK